MSHLALPLLVGLILVALTFDFLNGLHDAANSIATVVSTRVLSPRHAVVWAAFFNFIAAFGLSLSVAGTVGMDEFLAWAREHGGARDLDRIRCPVRLVFPGRDLILPRRRYGERLIAACGEGVVTVVH